MIAITVMSMLVRTFRVIPQARVGVIQRLGNYNRTAEAGLTVVMPLIDKMLPLIDMREQVVSFQPQPVTTSDNVTINVTSVVYYQILDAKNATYRVANLLPAMEQIAQTTLRNVMGGLTLDTSLTSRDEINVRLRLVLDEVTEKWGVRVNRVELKDISPPQGDPDRHGEEDAGGAEQARSDPDGRGRGPGGDPDGRGRGQGAAHPAGGPGGAVRMVMGAVNDSGAPDAAMQLQYMQMLPKLAENPANKVIVVPADMAGLAGLATSLSQFVQEQPEAQVRLSEGGTSG